jgi:hypothetical protein
MRLAKKGAGQDTVTHSAPARPRPPRKGLDPSERT